MLMIYERRLLFIVTLFLSVLSQTSQAHGCSSYSQYSYDWAGHRNWFLASPTSWNGILINMNTMKVDTVGNIASGAKAYEGTSIVSDDHENVRFYTNGRNVYHGNDTVSTTISYSGLLQGNENGGSASNGSATQGVIIVRHPLNINDYHVFTTDDAIGSTVGVNHFILDNQGNLKSGPNRLGNYRSSEGISATMHANGSDIWVATTDVSGKYNVYLVTCNGLDTLNSNLNQSGAPVLSGNMERGGMAFSWDRTKLAVAHANTGGNISKQIMLHDFDNSTGTISNVLNIGKTTTLIVPMDIVFSPNDKRLYISKWNSTIDYLDLTLGDTLSIANSLTSTGITNVNIAAIEIGATGKLYVAGGVSPSAGLIEINENIDTSTTFSTTIVAGTQGFSSYGLPTMYIPPVEVPVIKTIDPICYNADTVDLATIWHCAQTDTELIPHTYAGTGIIDTEKGIFDPSVAGVGGHKIDFYNSACVSNSDKMYITVINDNTCIITSTNSVTSNKSRVYPNPTNDIIYIGNDRSVQIYSTSGQLMLKSNSPKVNVSELKSGLYHIVITDAIGISFTEKLIKN
jgi:hypothetical protein